jgi:hypothetical protein
MQLNDKEYTVKLSNIILQFALDLLDANNGKTNPTYGELIDKPTNAIKELNKELKK